MKAAPRRPPTTASTCGSTPSTPWSTPRLMRRSAGPRSSTTRASLPERPFPRTGGPLLRPSPGKRRIARQVLTRLRFSKREAEWIASLVDHHEDPMPMGEKALKRLLGQHGEAFVFTLFQLQEGGLVRQGPRGIPAPPAGFGGQPRPGPGYPGAGRLPHPGGPGPFRGGFESPGHPPGPEMGSLLRRLLDAVQEGGVSNQPPRWRSLLCACGGKRGIKSDGAARASLDGAACALM